MKHLFVIGNGFDAYLHDFPTKYLNFKSYILDKYPGAKLYKGTTLNTTQTPEGDEIMMEDVVGCVTNILDENVDSEWNELETNLGSNLFDYMSWMLDDIPWDDTDNEISLAKINNENYSEEMKEAFGYMKQLVYEWVNDEIANLNFNIEKNLKIEQILRQGDIFLTFNYSET